MGRVMKILLFILVISTAAFAERKPSATVPQETINRLKGLYPDQSEGFIIERIQNTKSAFEKWRAFPPYFYELVYRSRGFLGGAFDTRQGLCAGDPHIENFGYVFLGKPFFSLNDLDDVSPCSLNTDAMRLFIGHRLITPVKAAEWLVEYKAGLSGLNTPAPESLEKLEKESAKKKTELSKKYRKLVESMSCSGEFAPATKEETQVIVDYLKTEGKELKLLCTRTKDTGGSAGNKRFVIFYPISSGIDAFELKPLATPAPVAPRILPLNEREHIYRMAVGTYLGANFANTYYPVVLGRQIFQRRPLWGGNVGITEADLTAGDLKEVALYQARTLGKYHRITTKLSFMYSNEEWEKFAVELEKKWRQEFAE